MLVCCASAGVLELPPPKKPPIAWPIEEPTATPAAVDAICPKSPGVRGGACACAGGSGWFVVAVGYAAVLEDRFGGVTLGRAGAIVGRDGALRAGAAAPRLWRGIVIRVKLLTGVERGLRIAR